MTNCNRRPSSAVKALHSTTIKERSLAPVLNTDLLMEQESNVLKRIKGITIKDKLTVKKSLNKISLDLLRLQRQLTDADSISKVLETRKFLESKSVDNYNKALI